MSQICLGGLVFCGFHWQVADAIEDALQHVQLLLEGGVLLLAHFFQDVLERCSEESLNPLANVRALLGQHQVMAAAVFRKVRRGSEGMGAEG